MGNLAVSPGHLNSGLGETAPLNAHQYQARRLNLLAEFQYSVVHIPGRTNPADFLMSKRFPAGSGPALCTGYDEQDSVLEFFTAAAATPAVAFVYAGTEPNAPRFLHAPSWPLRGATRSTPQERAPPPLAARLSCATGSSTVRVPAATVCTYQRPGICVEWCCRSSTPRRWMGTSVGTRACPPPGARYGGLVCLQPSLNTRGPAHRASVS